VTHHSLPHKRRANDREKDYRRYYDGRLAEKMRNYFKPDIEALAIGSIQPRQSPAMSRRRKISMASLAWLL
jgi:hypothetical protein